MDLQRITQQKWISAALITAGICLVLIFFFTHTVTLRTALTWFFISIGVYILIMNYLVCRDLFTPVGVMGPIWFITIGVANLQLSTYQQELDPTTWVVLLGSIGTFLLGSFTIAIIFSRSSEPGSPIDLDTFAARYQPQKIRNTIWFMFILSLVAYLVHVVRFGAIPIFSENLMQAYLEFPLPVWYYLMVLAMPVCLLIYIYRKLYQPKGEKIFIFIFLLSLLILISILARAFVLFVLVGVMVIKNHLGKKPIAFKYLVIMLIIALVFFIYIGNIRTSATGRNIIEIADLKIPPQYSFLAWPYFIISLNLENLRILVNNLDHYYYGAKTFFPILFFARVYKFIDYPALIIGKFATTSTYLADFYTDFGIIGTLLIPYILGVISTGIYYRLRSRPTLNLLLLNIIFIYTLLFSFLLNFLARQWIFVLLVLTPLIDFYCKKRN